MKTLPIALVLALLTPVPALAQPDASAWIRQVHHTASPSVVAVRCGKRLGTGFVFGEDRVVASTDRWDGCTRGIEVVLTSGGVVPVDVGRVSEHGVALLRLSSAAGVASLEPRSGGLEVGERILIVDRARDGGRVVSAGMIAGVPDETIRTDIRDPDVHDGAPVLDAEGRVVGVAHRDRGSDRVEILPVERLVSLDAVAETSLGYPLSLDIGLLGALVWDEDPAVSGRGAMLGGLGGSIRMSLFDRLALVASYVHVRDTSDLFEHDRAVERRAVRHQVDASLGWRFLGFYGVNAYVTPSVGATARWTTWTHRQLRLELEDPTCDPAASACEVATDIVETDDDDFSITPYVRIAVSAGPLELGYSLALAIDAPGTFVHQLSLTAWLGGNR